MLIQPPVHCLLLVLQLDGISLGPLMMKVLACVAPSWYTQGLACGEGIGLDVERIRNTDLFSQFMEKHPFNSVAAL